VADFPPAHPGEVLREDFLKPLQLSQYALAKAIAVPQIRISEIVNGKRAISAETALRLGRYFGNDAQFWVNLQAQYELAVATRDVGARVKREVEKAV